MSETVLPGQYEDMASSHVTTTRLPSIASLRPINRLPKHAVDNISKQATSYHASVGETLISRISEPQLVHFLMEGSIQIFKQDGSSETINSTDSQAKNALARFLNNATDIVACCPTSLIRIPWETLERYLIQYAPAELSSTLEVQEILSSTSSDWMVRLLQSDLFSLLPPTNIQEILGSLEFIDTFEEEVIVEEGSSGDHFYIVDQGEFLVSRQNSKTGANVELALLKSDDFFGEEALITGAPRSATVTSIGKGRLIRLNSQKFKEHIVAPTVPFLSADGAKSLVREGAHMIDIREPDKYAVGAIPQSSNIVLNLLRAEQARLDKQNTYIVVDDAPDAAATAVFILRAKGYDARCLNLPLQKYAVLQGIDLGRPSDITSNESLSVTVDSSKLDDSGFAYPSDEVSSQFADLSQLDLSSADEAVPEQTSVTITSNGLTDLIEELNETYEPASESGAILDSDEHTQANDFNVPADLAFTQVAGDSGYEISYLEEEDDHLQNSSSPTAHLEAYSEETRRALAIQREQLNTEFESKLAAEKQAALNEINRQRAQLDREFQAKRALLLENGKKLVALANKVRQQQADTQQAAKGQARHPTMTPIASGTKKNGLSEYSEQLPEFENWSSFLRTVKH